MTYVKLDGTVIRIDPNRSAVSTCGSGGTSVAGVEAIEVGQTRLSGVVSLQGDGVSVSGNTITVASSGTGVSLLRDLNDVAITLDGNGVPIVADGSVLRFETFEGSQTGVWVAAATLDGGGYT